jgi:hypothetical protein
MLTYVDNDNKQFDLRTDLVYGAQAIAALTGLNSRTLQKHAALEGLPIFRIGRAHCADRRVLLQWLESRGGIREAAAAKRR